MSKHRAGQEVGLYNRWQQPTGAQREPTVYRLTAPGPEGAVPILQSSALIQPPGVPSPAGAGA